MRSLTPVFKDNLYRFACPIVKTVPIGSVLCVGKKDPYIPPCGYCMASEHNDTWTSSRGTITSEICTKVIC